MQEFPYFQTAQALLAKAMREQEHVRFDKQLKIAAAYCGDRKSLYALINHKPKSIFVESNPESPFISPSAIEVVSDESPFIEKPIFEIDNSTFQEVDEKPIPIFEPVFQIPKKIISILFMQKKKIQLFPDGFLLPHQHLHQETRMILSGNV